MGKVPTWTPETIADFRRAFADLRQHPIWCDYRVAADLLGYKSARGLRWAAGEYHSDNWPGSYRLAAQLREIFAGVFTWTPPRKHEVDGCPTCGEPHLAGDCHGVPVAQVVCLAPGASVKSARRPAEPWVAQAVTNLARLEQQRPVDTAPRVYNRAGQRVVFCPRKLVDEF